MFVCAKCFANGELQADVSSSVREGVCDIFHETVRVKDLTEYEAFFSELLGLFTKAETGKNVVDFIDEEWNIFCNRDVARRILAEIIKSRDFGYTLENSVDYNNEIKERISVWKRLKDNVKYRSRFFTSIDEFDQYHYLSVRDGLNEGDELYRARIMTDVLPFSCNQMGCPPKELSKPGRANPIGIPYLYLCDNPKTTYYEVRSVYLDCLSVGKFKVSRDLKLVDFTYKLDLYAEFIERDSSLKDIVIQSKIMEAISRDLSKPLRRFDSELEYVPTQMICEYCKNIVHADGISFESSLYKGGKNYVLFDESNAECVEVEKHVIHKIDIDKDW
jgi:hypothetical protein